VDQTVLAGAIDVHNERVVLGDERDLSTIG
jgi:hypothetical protein